mgnify:CR=1 FL=1
MMNSREIYVSISLDGENYFVGTLWGHFRKGRERASFEYSRSWLQHPECFSIETAFSIIKECKISKKRAKEIVEEVKDSVCCWQKVAKDFGLDKKEIDCMSSAFEI